MRRSRLVGSALLTLSVVLLASISLDAAENSPVVPVPQERWGALEPRGIPGDTSSFTFNSEPRCPRDLFWFNFDAEGGWLFAAAGNAVEVWSLADPAEPELHLQRCEPLLGAFKKSDTDFFWFYVDAPPGDPSVFAVGLGSKMGVEIWTHDQGTATLVYQDEGKSTYGEDFTAKDVVALQVGSRQLAFVLTSKNDVLAYDLAQARALTSPCLAEDGCGRNVFLGVLPGKALAIAGAGSRLMYARPDALDVYDLSVSPVSPSLLGSFKPGIFVIDVAAWTQGGKTHAAVSTVGTVESYDLSCLPSCSGKARVIPVPGGQYVSASHDPASGKSYLYVGTNQSLVGGVQLEYLFDTTTWEELTPKEHAGGYWGWYYEGNSTGFRNVKPTAAIVRGNHVYRAAFGLFDVHEIVGGGGPPTAAFTWSPEKPYVGDPVDFTDASTRNPTAWDWAFTDADSTSDVLQNPQDVAFLSVGNKDVTLVAWNEFGPSDPLTKTVEVLDPAPAIQSVTVNVTAAPVCSEIVFTAAATGKPPLSYAWEVLDSANVSIGAVDKGSNKTDDTFVWEVPVALAPGEYKASVVVTGTSTTPAKLSPVVTIEELADLAFLDGGDLPIADPATYVPQLVNEDLGLAAFAVNAQGATRWTWSFGDGACPAGFTPVTGGACTTTDPNLGTKPVHQYTEEFTTNPVTVTIENCRDGSITSGVLQVEVTTVEKLEAKFTAQDLSCSNSIAGLVCTAEIGKEIIFLDESTGFPEVWEVDWDGPDKPGGFAAETPVAGKLTHTYNAAGIYKPVLRVKRGAQTSTYLDHPTIEVGSVSPPSVTVSRSTSAPLVNENVIFTATANNCTAPTSWTWSIGSGGSFSGASNTSSVTVSYSSAGSRTVTATANGGGCSGLSGSTSVTVQNPDDPGPGPSPTPTASFSYTPSSPQPGVPVSFDASGSSGATGYTWLFGDGSQAVGQKVAHTFAQPGSYEVTLEASAPGASCPFQLCIGTTKRTVVVGGGAPDPNPGPAGNGCSGALAGDDEIVCLANGRFQVRVHWMNHHQPEPHPESEGVLARLSDKTATAWFFRDGNTDVIFKLLDGRPVNGHWWFFYGGVSDVVYTLTVTDTGATPHRVKTYQNQAGNIDGVGDTAAFPELTGGGSSATGASHGIIPHDGEDEGTEETPVTPTSETLELFDERFAVEVDWHNHDTGETGHGLAVPGNGRTGYFTFFNLDNVELVFKIIDASDFDGYFWTFWGGLSHVEYTITVTDRDTGNTWSTTKPHGSIQGGADLRALED